MDEKCYIEPVYKDLVPAEKLQKAEKATLIVWGMGCPNCVTRVRNSLLVLDGVYGVDVYLNMAVAEVSYDSQKIMPMEFAAAVASAAGLLALLVATCIAVYKPRGMTVYGWRKQYAERSDSSSNGSSS